MEDSLIIGYDESKEIDHTCLTVVRRINGITYVLNQLYDEEAKEVYEKLVKKEGN